MNHSTELLLLLITATLILLPFIPTLREWLQPTDATPLPIDQFATQRLRHLADSMRGLMETLLGQSPTRAELHGYGKSLFHNGTQITILHNEDGMGDAQTGDVLEAVGKRGQIAVFVESAAITPGCETLADIYAMEDLHIGDDVSLRAGCVLGDARIGANVLVHRWIDADTIVAGQNLAVHGRITALKSISFSHNSTFVRGGAPTMYFGDEVSRHATPIHVEHPIATPADTKRFLFDGDITVAEDTPRHGNFIVRGSARVNAGCHIAGSIKTYDFLRIGENVNIAGAVMASKAIVIGAGCAILGPIISEDDIIIGPNCLIGSPAIPTTVTCRKLVVAKGVVIHGVVTTLDSAHVVFEEIPLAV
jgi:cytoskeletal protein CcmA (bactofilin family)